MGHVTCADFPLHAQLWRGEGVSQATPMIKSMRFKGHCTAREAKLLPGYFQWDCMLYRPLEDPMHYASRTAVVEPRDGAKHGTHDNIRVTALLRVQHLREESSAHGTPV